jgi:hypothetical protein
MLLSRLDAAAILIDNHLRHDHDCAQNHPYYPLRGFNRRPCSCGLDSALSAYRSCTEAKLSPFTGPATKCTTARCAT